VFPSTGLCSALISLFILDVAGLKLGGPNSFRLK
jgi:hypothetical protein